MAKTKKKTQKPKPQRMICYDNDGRLAVRYRGASPDDMIYWLGLGVFVESMGVEVTQMLKNAPLDKVGEILMTGLATGQEVARAAQEPAAAEQPRKRARKRG